MTLPTLHSPEDETAYTLADAEMILANEQAWWGAYQLTKRPGSRPYVPRFPADILERARATTAAAAVPSPPAERCEPTPRRGFVYIFKRGNLVKIGFSGQPEIRRKTLENQAGEAVTVVSVWPGTTDDEATLHRRFQAYRTVGEWFRYDGALKAFVRTLRDPNGASDTP